MLKEEEEERSNNWRIKTPPEFYNGSSRRSLVSSSLIGCWVAWVKLDLGWEVSRAGIVALFVFPPRDILDLQFLCTKNGRDRKTHVAKERVFNSHCKDEEEVCANVCAFR